MKNKLFAIITVILLATIAGCKQPLLDSRVMDEDMDNLIATLKQGDSSGVAIDEVFVGYDRDKIEETKKLAKTLWGKVERANIVKKTHLGLNYYYWIDFTQKGGKSVRVRTEYSSWNGTIGLYLRLVGERQ